MAFIRGTVEISAGRGVNAQTINIVTKIGIITALIETGILTGLGRQIIS